MNEFNKQHGAKMKITELCPDTKYSRSDWVIIILFVNQV